MILLQLEILISSDEIDLEYNSSRYRKLLDIKNQLR